MTGMSKRLGKELSQSEMQNADSRATQGKNILFLDGECVFCQKSAQFIHRLDKKGLIHFAPLQGKTAELLPDKWKLSEKQTAQAPGAVVLVENLGDNQVFWRGADAVLRTLNLIGGVWRIFWPLHHLPQCMKEGVYQLVAKNRYRIAGKNTACDLPDDVFKSKMFP